MSDTTTITPEERTLWASVATSRINAVTPERQCEITAQERLVKALKALEQAEARVKSRNNHIHMLLGEALENERNLDGMKSRWQTAEAENARLTKMVDWLAEKQIRCAANGEQWYGPTISKELHVPMYPSKNEAIDALVEAARRAVAAGEDNR